MGAPQEDTDVSLDEMKDRIGRALGEAMGMRWQITGNGNEITIMDKWALGNEFRLTLEKTA